MSAYCMLCLLFCMGNYVVMPPTWGVTPHVRGNRTRFFYALWECGSFGPGGFVCTTRSIRSWPLLVPSFSLLLAQAALRAPPKVVFAMPRWPLLLPSFSLSFSVFCFRETPEAENYFSPIFWHN